MGQIKKSCFRGFQKYIFWTKKIMSETNKVIYRVFNNFENRKMQKFMK